MPFAHAVSLGELRSYHIWEDRPGSRGKDNGRELSQTGVERLTLVRLVLGTPPSAEVMSAQYPVTDPELLSAAQYDCSSRLTYLNEVFRPCRPTGAEIFTVYGALDNVRFAICDKYPAIVKTEIATEGVFDVDRALANIPSSFTMTMFYYEKSYGGSETAANDNLAMLCTHFDSVSPSM